MKNGSDTVTKIVSGIALAALSISKRDSAILASQTGYPRTHTNHHFWDANCAHVTIIDDNPSTVSRFHDWCHHKEA